MRALSAFLIPICVALSIAGPIRSQDSPPQVPGVEVQARGPIHEAFAQPANSPPVQGPVVAKEPPAPVDELPPDQKPEGDNVQWIPGYWTWDDDTSDFIWVSGCWRIPPPGQHWVPGHWQGVSNGWLWVSGFWTPDGTANVQYLPPPPPTLEQGPAAPAPDANSVYAPGCWVYVDTGYRWRPGHWIAFRPDWIWVPACYVWTPSGCLFIDGYWDHPFDQRGLLFSPIRFDRRLWVGGAFIPQFVIQSDFLLGAMFVRLADRHFYFGDYFEPLYDKRGFVAWPDYHPIPKLFDPSFAYYRHLHAGDARWEPALRELYTGRRSGDIPRPPRTLVRQFEDLKTLSTNRRENEVVNKNINITHIQNASVLTPISKIQAVKINNLATISGGKGVPGREIKLLPVAKDEHERQVKSATQLRDIGQQRRENEAKMLHEGGIPVQHTDPPKPAKLEIPKPPPPIARTEVQKVVPARIVPPMHEERPIPKYEPVRPPEPPKKK